MRIFLIDPPGDQRGWNAGLAWLSGALSRAEVEHAVLDMVNAAVSDAEMIAAVESYSPDIIGVSLKTATYYAAVRIADEIKKKWPCVPVIAGGPHVTMYHEELLNETTCFDAAVLGDAEESIVDLARQFSPNSPLPQLSGMARRGCQDVSCIPRQAPMNLDGLAFPEFDHHLSFDVSWHPYPLVTSRGCPYGCIFCSVGRVSGRKWRSRSPENVVDELERAASKWGFRDFDVLDDTFTQDVDRAREICRLLIERRLNMRWSCPNGIRADRVTPELMTDMARAGCHTVIFGVESADPELFKSINKSENQEDIVRAIRHAKAADMRVGGYFIIGLPGDSFEKNIRGLEFAKEIGLDWAHFNMLAPYPGTKVWDEIQKRGRFLADYRRAQHFSSKIQPIFELNDFSADDIARTYKTVHVKQGLYHLLLPANLTDKQKKRAIRRLRMTYDREAWRADIKRDVTQVLRNITVPAKALWWDVHKSKAGADRHAGSARREARPSMRVLMVNDFIGRAGGTEKYIYDIINNLIERGHGVAWAYEKDIGSEGVNVPKYKMTGLASPAPEKAVVDALDRILDEFNPDIIHIHNVHAPGMVNAALERRPAMRTAHDHNIVCPSMNKMWKTGEICSVPAGLRCIERLLDGGCYVLGMRPGLLLERLSVCLDGLAANHRLKKIMVTTDFMRNELVQNGFNPNRIETLPLFLDFPPDCAPPDESLPLRILWAGRVVLPDKGTDYFIDSLRYMRSPFEATIAGYGPHMDFVRAKAHDLGLDGRVKFIGKVSRDEMNSLYKSSHVVAFTSMWAEPFGYVGIEAAANCRPVVAFAAGGVAEWLDDRVGGFIVRRGDCRALALRLDRLALNAKERAKMGAAHRASAIGRYDRRQHMDRLVNAYRELIAS